MTIEQILAGLLATVCARVYPDVAPPGTAAPYITWQVYGGEPIPYIDATLPAERGAWVQVTCWATTRLEAVQLSLSAESALIQSGVSGFVASARSGVRSQYSETDDLRGSSQDFDLWGPRT